VHPTPSSSQAAFRLASPRHHIEVGFLEMLREGEGWRKGETWSSRVNPDGPIDPEAIKIHRIRSADLKNCPRFSTILPKVKDFVGDSPMVAPRLLRLGVSDYRFDHRSAAGSRLMVPVTRRLWPEILESLNLWSCSAL
jgi:hypothetical protein